MKSFASALAWGVFGQLVAAEPVAALLRDRAVCNADNCARAAAGTRGGAQASKFADCSLFQTTTTSLIAASGVTMIGPTGTVPDYASACSGTSRYSSACSCAGITPSQTITIIYPTDVPCQSGMKDSEVCSGESYTVTCGYDVAPSGNQYDAAISVLTPSYSACFKACDEEAYCLSFHYNVRSGRCDVYGYDISTPDLSTHRLAQRADYTDIWTYYNRDIVPKCSA